MSKIVSTKQVYERWLEEQKEIARNPEKFGPKPTGIKSLDLILEGGPEPGSYVVIGGAQKSGKSILLQNIMQTAARRGDKFLFITIEMLPTSICQRIVSNISGFERKELRNIELLENGALKPVEEEIEKYDGGFTYGVYTAEEIDKTLRSMDELPDIIFVDYVQLMEDKYRGSRTEQLAAISRYLKRITVEFDKKIIVYAAVQLNRMSIRLGLYDANAFHGTGAFERDMDYGIIIENIINPETGKPWIYKRLLKVVGSRYTGIGETVVRFNGALARVEDEEFLEVTNVEEAIQYWQE